MSMVREVVLGIALGATGICSAQAPVNPAPVSAAPAAPKQVDPAAVVANVDGRPVTVKEIRAFLNALPAQNRTAALQNPEDFLRQYALMSKLTKVAEEQNLSAESPYKEQIEYNRQMILSTAGLNLVSQQLVVSDAEARSFYEANKDDYTEVRVKVIYLPFLNAMPKPGEARTSQTESEALALAQQLVKDLRNGADFVEMVKKHSKDEGSAKRDGDFATFKKVDTIPAEVKDAVFPLEAGSISDPVRQANGFYIFRVEEKKLQPYKDVVAALNSKLHDQKFRKKLDEMRGAIDIQDLKADLLKP